MPIYYNSVDLPIWNALDMWIGKLSEKNYTVLFLNLVLDSNPVILHSNMNFLKDGQIFILLVYFQISCQIYQSLLFSLYCWSYRLIMYLWVAIINKTLDTVVNFSVYCPSPEVTITSSLSQHVLAHTSVTHRQHLY